MSYISCHSENQPTQITVTELISKYHDEFDIDFWSTYKVLKEVLKGNDVWDSQKSLILKTKVIPESVLSLVNTTELKQKKQEIIDDWELKSKQARERGIQIHNDRSTEITPTNVWIEKSLELDLGDFVLKGRPDKVIVDNDGVIIVDIKTNEKINNKAMFNQSTRSSLKMHYPISNLDDTVLNHYQLQLSLYAYMIESLYHLKVKELIIDHVTDNKEIKCSYLRQEVQRMLSDYGKKIRLMKVRTRRSKIVY